jgi:hypothetical protein
VGVLIISREQNHYGFSSSQIIKQRKMKTDKRTLRVVGALFLTALVTNEIGSELMEASIFAPDYIIAVSANKTQMIIRVILELICAAAVIGIPVMMYPILKQYNKRIALGYLIFYGLPMSLNELFMAIRLIVKGFNSPTIHSVSSLTKN